MYAVVINMGPEMGELFLTETMSDVNPENHIQVKLFNSLQDAKESAKIWKQGAARVVVYDERKSISNMEQC